MSFLEIRNLEKRFGAHHVLRDISIAEEEGAFLVLVGPSGCGKSTLLSMIAGLDTLSSGEIHIGGRRVDMLPSAKRDIAMVFQSYALYPTMTVGENIGFALEMQKVPKAERDAAIRRVAETLQISTLLDRKPAQLSGGQRQRVAMGRALVRNPSLFLFDEPLSNLDAKLRVDMRVEMKRLHSSLGRTTVYVTHDQIEALTLATRIAVLKDGALQQLGSPDDIYSRPANTFVADFMGSPAMNIIPATFEPETAQLTLESGITIPVPPAKTHALPQSVLVGIRPEAITDPDGVDRNAQLVAVVDCPVELVEPAGSDTFVLIRLGGHQITARCRASAALAPGETLPFHVNMDRAVFFDPISRNRIG